MLFWLMSWENVVLNSLRKVFSCIPMLSVIVVVI